MSTDLPVVSHDGMQLGSSRILRSCASLSCSLVSCLSQYPWTWSGPGDFQFAMFVHLFLMSSLVILCACWVGTSKYSFCVHSAALWIFGVPHMLFQNVYVSCLGFLLLTCYCCFGSWSTLFQAVCWTFYLSCIFLFWQCTYEVCEIQLSISAFHLLLLISDILSCYTASLSLPVFWTFLFLHSLFCWCLFSVSWFCFLAFSMVVWNSECLFWLFFVWMYVMLFLSLWLCYYFRIWEALVYVIFFVCIIWIAWLASAVYCIICCIFRLSIHSGFLSCAFEVVLIHSVHISSSRESFFVASAGVWGESWLGGVVVAAIVFLHVQDLWCPVLFCSAFDLFRSGFDLLFLTAVLRIFIWDLLHLAICLLNLYTRCEARPDSPVRECGQSAVCWRFKKC